MLKGHIAVSAAVFPTGTKGRWFLLSYGRLFLDQASNMCKSEWRNMSFPAWASEGAAWSESPGPAD